jgi:hypothetical protein
VIVVDESQVVAVLIGGQWLNVTAVHVDFAQYDDPDGTRYARGPHLAATLGPGGPNAGHQVVAALSRVEAIRVAT